jgi:hypothetical protein
LRGILKNCINYFERDERQMRNYYEARVKQLTEELSRHKNANGDLSFFSPEQEAVIMNIMK